MGKSAAVPAGVDPELVERIAREQIILRPVADLRAADRNPRTHSKEQLESIERSMREFGWTNPVLVDEDGVLIAGHGRVEVATRLGLDRVPTITLRGLSPQQKQAYLIADNQIALGSGWNVEMLGEIMLDLGEQGFDSQLLGFDDDDLAALFGKQPASEDHYTHKLEVPVYTPQGEKPEIAALADASKANALIEKIEASGATAEEKEFLRRAAVRHVVFDYRAIAEFYCHASPEVQALMEDSALVIIDIDKAIENGFVQMSKRLEELYSSAYGDEGGEAGSTDDAP